MKLLSCLVRGHNYCRGPLILGGILAGGLASCSPGWLGGTTPRNQRAAIWRGVDVSFDTISVRDIGPGDTLLVSYAWDWPHECVAVVREPQQLRAYRYHYRNQDAYTPVQYPDTAARFYERNRGQWEEVARSTLPVFPTLDSLQGVLTDLYAYRDTRLSIVPKVYYLRAGPRRSYVRAITPRIRSEYALQRILRLTTPPPARSRR